MNKPTFAVEWEDEEEEESEVQVIVYVNGTPIDNNIESFIEYTHEDLNTASEIIYNLRTNIDRAMWYKMAQLGQFNDNE